MDKLQLPHAKLFYFSAELYKNQTITESEKLKLKEMVINDEPAVFELLERYQSNGSEKEFINGLLALLRPHQRHLYQQQQQQQQQQNQLQQYQQQQTQQQQQQQPRSKTKLPKLLDKYHPSAQTNGLLKIQSVQQNSQSNGPSTNGFRIQMQQQQPPQPASQPQQQQLQQQKPPQQQQQQQQHQEFYTEDIHPSISQLQKINTQNEEIAQFIEKHPDCPDEISSPLGLKLLKRKQNHKKANPQIKDYLRPSKIVQD